MKKFHGLFICCDLYCIVVGSAEVYGWQMHDSQKRSSPPPFMCLRKELVTLTHDSLFVTEKLRYIRMLIKRHRGEIHGI